MGTPSTLIIKVTTPDFKKVIVDTSDGRRFHADLSTLSTVYCFPKNPTEWSQVTPDSFGSALIWTSRFEAHIDQIIGLAFKTESGIKSA